MVGFPAFLSEGKAGIFIKPAGGWRADANPNFVLSPSQECNARSFGRDIDISRDGVMVGTTGACANWFPIVGNAYPISPTAIAFGSGFGDDPRWFGYSVSLDDGRALIGGRAADGFGSAYLFRTGIDSDLSVNMHSNAKPYLGVSEEIEYELTVSNLGKMAARKVEVTIEFDDLLNNFPFERISTPSNCRSGERLVCQFAAIRAGAQVTVNFSATIKSDAVDVIGARAQIQSVPGDFNPANNWAVRWAFIRM